MGFDPKNFKFSPDVKDMSGDEFKAFIKVRYPQLRVKEIKELYNTLHGNPISVPREVSED